MKKPFEWILFKCAMELLAKGEAKQFIIYCAAPNIEQLRT